MDGELFISTVFLAGFLSFFAPCILPILPVYVSNLSLDILGNKSKEYKIYNFTIHPMLILKTFIFVLGISTVFVILGFGAGILGSVINSKLFLQVCGIIVILLGIHQTGLLQFNLLNREKKLNVEPSNSDNILGTFILGVTFSFGWSPCIGPILGAVLGVSASGGQVFYGAWMMFVYSIGLMIPFMILAIFSDVLISKVKKLNKHINKIKIVGGVLIIFMGILLLTDNLNFMTSIIYSIN